MKRYDVPFMDLYLQNKLVLKKVHKSWKGISRSSDYILGERVREFEVELAKFYGVEFAIGLANGTDALELLLRASGAIQKNRRQVILPANTFAATAMSVIRAGGEPRFVDVLPGSLLINPKHVEACVSEKTAAVIPVHLFGQMANVKGLHQKCGPMGIKILEDGAQSQGAEQLGLRTGEGSIGLATSFYPAKNLGAFGDAGAALTNSETIAARLKQLRNYGSEHKYHHPTVGFNSRLDVIQATVLLEKLKHLRVWNAQRASIAEQYFRGLRDISWVRLLDIEPGNHCVWHLFPIRVPHRDRLIKFLSLQGIGTGIHYPIPLSRQTAFVSKKQQEEFPVAELAAETQLSLPMFPGMKKVQVDRVIDAIRKFGKMHYE